jgi:hypothetical protein
MSEEKINYTKEAFLIPWNLIFLIMAMMTAFFLSGTGAVTEIILLFTAAVELLFLGTVPRNERFRRMVRSRHNQARHKPPSEKEVFRQLSRDSQRRHVRFRNLEKAVKENYRRLPFATQGMLDAHLKKIDSLLDSHLNLLNLSERYQSFLKQSAENDITTSIEGLQREMATDPPKVRAIKERRLTILQKRLEKFQAAYENLAVVRAQLATIEDVTQYIHEQSLTMRSPEEISFQLDSLLSEVEETQNSLETIDDIMLTPSALLTDLDQIDEPQPETTRQSRDRLRS